MNLKDLNDEVHSLIPAAKEGDSASTHRLWELVRPFMEGSAYRYLVKFYRDTEELPGVCYIAFEDSLRRYDESRDFTFISFCLFMVKYHMINYLKRRVEVERQETPFSAMLSTSLEEEEEPDDFVDRGIYHSMSSSLYQFDDEALLRVTLESRISGANLNPTCIKVVEMLMNGYTPCEIQRHLGLARSSYYHIVRRLREVLDGLEDYV